VLALAERHFTAIGMTRTTSDPRARGFTGVLGTARIGVKMEGGHYTFVDAVTDQVGESRLDKNVKKFFNALHRAADPRHAIEAGY
jgi:hypothetical protein